MEQVRKWRHCMGVVIFKCTETVHSVPYPFSPNDAKYCQSRQHIWCQRRAAFAQIIFAVLMATAFGKMCPKCGAQCKSCSLQYALKFQQKWWWTRTTSFAPFTLCWHLCSLHTLIGEIDSYSPSTKELLEYIMNNMLLSDTLKAKSWVQPRRFNVTGSETKILQRSLCKDFSTTDCLFLSCTHQTPSKCRGSSTTLCNQQLKPRKACNPHSPLHKTSLRDSTLLLNASKKNCLRKWSEFSKEDIYWNLSDYNKAQCYKTFFSVNYGFS
jgi:hypothetical protein